MSRQRNELSAAARQRLSWLVLWQKAGSAGVAARLLGIARSTLYAVARRFDSEHLTGLDDRSRRPHRTRTPKWPPRLVKAVKRLHRSNPGWGSAKLAKMLAEEGLRTSASTVLRILRRMEGRRPGDPGPGPQVDRHKRGPPASLDGPALRAARASMGLTQAGLAELLGVTRATVNRWEQRRGCVPRVVSLAVACLQDLKR